MDLTKGIEYVFFCKHKFMNASFDKFYKVAKMLIAANFGNRCLPCVYFGIIQKILIGINVIRHTSIYAP